MSYQREHGEKLDLRNTIDQAIGSMVGGAIIGIVTSIPSVPIVLVAATR